MKQEQLANNVFTVADNRAQRSIEVLFSLLRKGIRPFTLCFRVLLSVKKGFSFSCGGGGGCWWRGGVKGGKSNFPPIFEDCKCVEEMEIYKKEGKMQMKKAKK